MCACATTLQTNNKNGTENNFIILKNNDTIYGRKIRFSRGFNKIGNVKVVKVNGEKLTYGYDKVYQVHEYRKGENSYVQEFVMLTPNNPVSLTLMDVIINTGSVRLYENDPTNFPNIPFVVSDFFYGYVRNQARFNKLLEKFDTCDAFIEKYPKSIQRKRSDLRSLIEFYNKFCRD